jgi:hypothetical protein
MWTIGFQPNGCASHAYRAGKSAESMEMLAFAHIPTGATTSNNYNFDSEERGARGKGLAFAFSVPCRATNRMKGTRGRPGSKGGSGIFCEGVKNLPVPRRQEETEQRAFDQGRRRAAIIERKVGTEGWAFSGSNKGMRDRNHHPFASVGRQAA